MWTYKEHKVEETQEVFGTSGSTVYDHLEAGRKWVDSEQGVKIENQVDLLAPSASVDVEIGSDGCHQRLCHLSIAGILQ